jgi:hypothetical protein
VEIILQVLKFPTINSFEEHWKLVEKFIVEDTKKQMQLGYMLHDFNGDGKICPSDVFDFSKKLIPSQTLIGQDIFYLISKLQSKHVVEEKQPGYILR